MRTKKQTLKKPLIAFIYVWITISLIGWVDCRVSLAQTNDSEKQSIYEESQKRIVESQSRLKEEIAKIKAAIELQAPDKRKGSPSFARQQLELLQKIDLTYDQQLFELRRSLDLEQTIKQLKEELSAIINNTTLRWLGP